MKLLVVTAALFCAVSSKPSWVVPRHNQWGDVGPSGIVTGAGAAGPSGVVNGLGARGPAGIVTGHGAVSLAGQSSAIRDDNIGVIGHGGIGLIRSAPILLSRPIISAPIIAGVGINRWDDGRWEGDDGRWDGDDGRWNDGNRWDDGNSWDDGNRWNNGRWNDGAWRNW